MIADVKFLYQCFNTNNIFHIKYFQTSVVFINREQSQ